MSMKIEIIISGLALCYIKDNFWQVVFICDDVHPINFQVNGVQKPPLHIDGMDRTISFDIGTSPMSAPAKGMGFKSIFNLAAGYAHGPNKLSEISDDDSDRNTDVVIMKIPAATLDLVELTKGYYYVQDGTKIGDPVQVILPVAHIIHATFEVTDTKGLIMSIEDDDGTDDTPFAYQNKLTLSFDNDCGKNCHGNDFLLFYDWVQDKDGREFVAGEVKNTIPKQIAFSHPEKIENFIPPGIKHVESATFGDCDPAVIDPPPGPPALSLESEKSA